jgi:hypothetical protein
MYSSIDEESICAALIEQGRMKVGYGCYSTVVVPFAEYISVGALEKLVDFARSGGHIIFVGKTPKHAHSMSEDGRISELMAELSGQDFLDASDSDDLMRLLAEYVAVEFKAEVVSGACERLLVGDFKDDERKASFFVNTSDKPMSVKICSGDECSTCASVHYPATGDIRLATLSPELIFEIPAYEGVLIVRGIE